MQAKSLNKIRKIIVKTIKKNSSPLHEPYFDSKELAEVKKTIKSSFVSTIGKSIEIFEKKISRFVKSKFTLCVNSGTSALHISLKILGVDKNSLVLMPSLTFVAAANAVRYNQAEPYFLDSNKSNYGICSKDLEDTLKKNVIFKKGRPYCKITKKKVSAILVVHAFGYAADILEIIKIARKYKIPVIEDAADCFGTKVFGKYLGTFGEVGILSFNGNKTITSGSGGAILTNNKKLFNKASKLITVAKRKHKWKVAHDEVGYNYKMNALNASLGVAQIRKINLILKRKKTLHNNYKKNFQNIEDVELVTSKKNIESNYWINMIKVKNIFIRDKILNYLSNHKIYCRPVWELMHTLPMYKNFKRSKILKAKDLYNTTICLPSSPII
tara:strand:+ start:7530 stop:8681 length:1152 start_codon:yes stop_codon:yes gene_type:complete